MFVRFFDDRSGKLKEFLINLEAISRVDVDYFYRDPPNMPCDTNFGIDNPELTLRRYTIYVNGEPMPISFFNENDAALQAVSEIYRNAIKSDEPRKDSE